MSHPPSLLPFAYFRKKIIPSGDANISIASHSLQYGTGCFGGIRGYFRDGKIRVFRLQDHFQRLSHAAKIVGIPFALVWEDFLKIIAELVMANAPKSDFYIRPFLFSENAVLKPRFDGIDYDLAVYFMPLTHYFDQGRGLRLMISSWRKISDGMISTKAKVCGSYVNSALATTEARHNGYDDALMLDDQGNVVEATVANIFLFYKGELFTPEVGASMLDGITRRTVIELLQEEGYAIRFERIDRSMIYACDELLLTGTAAQVTHVHSVDGRIIGQGDIPGPFCHMLRQKFAEIIAGTCRQSQIWITEF